MYIVLLNTYMYDCCAQMAQISSAAAASTCLLASALLFITSVNINTTYLLNTFLKYVFGGGGVRKTQIAQTSSALKYISCSWRKYLFFSSVHFEIKLRAAATPRIFSWFVVCTVYEKDLFRTVSVLMFHSKWLDRRVIYVLRSRVKSYVCDLIIREDAENFTMMNIDWKKSVISLFWSELNGI